MSVIEEVKNLICEILIMSVIEEVKNLICEMVLMNTFKFSCQKFN